MNLSGEPTVEELLARIAALQRKSINLPSVVKLEEELALARLHRFAPKSEKHIDRLFNEAEEAADKDYGEEGDVVIFRTPACHPPKAKRERNAAADRCRKTCRANASNMTFPTKACPCCQHQMHRMGEAVSEQLHIEVKAKVLQNVRFKYACRHCDRTVSTRRW